VVSYIPNSLSDVDWDAKYLDLKWLERLLATKPSAETMHDDLVHKTPETLDQVMRFSLKYHADNVLFRAFKAIISKDSFPLDMAISWIEQWPPLVFVLLKVYPPDEQCLLPPNLQTTEVTHAVARNLVRCGNSLGMACLVGLEKISASIAELPMAMYLDILMLTALCIRSPQLVQELLLVLDECRRCVQDQSRVLRYAHKHALSVAFDRAEEAADECPCDDNGKPRKRGTAPTLIKLLPDPEASGSTNAIAHVRVDAKTAVRLHSHVRLQVASKPEKGWAELVVLDGVVKQAMKGTLKIELMYPPPPEMDRMDWKMYNAGSTGK
jgi:hypothetical protein